MCDRVHSDSKIRLISTARSRTAPARRGCVSPAHLEVTCDDDCITKYAQAHTHTQGVRSLWVIITGGVCVCVCMCFLVYVCLAACVHGESRL